jgi:hypothetical protein
VQTAQVNVQTAQAKAKFGLFFELLKKLSDKGLNQIRAFIRVKTNGNGIPNITTCQSTSSRIITVKIFTYLLGFSLLTVLFLAPISVKHASKKAHLSSHQNFFNALEEEARLDITKENLWL